MILDRAERAMRAAEGGRRRRPEYLRRCRRRPLCASAPGSSEVMPAGGDVMCRCGGAPWSSTQQWTLVSWKDTLPVRPLPLSPTAVSRIRLRPLSLSKTVRPHRPVTRCDGFRVRLVRFWLWLVVFGGCFSEVVFFF